MDSQLPYLHVRGPDGREFVVELGLDKDTFTIGLLPEYNDMALQPDPQRLIRRQKQCLLTRVADTWSVVDEESVNPTTLLRVDGEQRVRTRTALIDGDVIRILGRRSDSGERTYWELTFRDPMKTQAPDAQRELCLEYDAQRDRLFRLDAGQRMELASLSKQERALFRYLDHRNRESAASGVFCSHYELVTAIWGDPDDPTRRAHLNRLVWSLRQKVEVDPKQPRFILNHPSGGYCLEPHAFVD